MSAGAALSRRAFLGLLRKKEPLVPAPAPAPPASPPTPGGAAPAPGFSLEAFYAARARSGAAQAAPAVFSLREGLAVPQDGALPLRRPQPAPQALPGTHPAAAPALAVRVRSQLCLAWQGSFCSTCSERCPVEGAIAVEQGRPRVVAERCDGCGLCVQVCPAPLNAFEFAPSPPTPTP